MVEKRHSKICRHKAFTILSLIAVVVAIIILLRIKSLKDTYKSESEDLVPLVSLISTVLQWKDSAYCVVAESGDLCPILEKENAGIFSYLHSSHMLIHLLINWQTDLYQDQFRVCKS